MRKVLVLLAGLLLLSVPEGSAEVFRWVDRSGNENFTNDLNKVPAEFRGSARPVGDPDERVRVGEPLPQTAAAPAKANEHRDRYGHGEEWWRRRAENLRRELRDLQDDYDLVLKKERDREESDRNGPLKKKKKAHSNSDAKKQQLEKKMMQVKRRLEVDLPEEARKADAYPGWIRE